MCEDLSQEAARPHHIKHRGDRTIRSPCALTTGRGQSLPV